MSKKKVPAHAFTLVTLFPDACNAYLTASIIGRAQKEKKITVAYQNPRDFSDGAIATKKTGTWKYGKVDDRPYGGGPGMVMLALPIIRAVEKAVARKKGKTAVIWFTPGAKPFTNADADALLRFQNTVLVCGRYEGIDARAKKILTSFGTLKEYSVGDAVYTGGEIPALAIVDAMTRRIPGVLGKDESVEERRVSSHELYTRPEILIWKGKKHAVPQVLRTGHHQNIEGWKKAS